MATDGDWHKLMIPQRTMRPSMIHCRRQRTIMTRGLQLPDIPPPQSATL